MSSLKMEPFSMRRSSSRGMDMSIHGFRSSTWVSSDGMSEKQESKKKGFGVKARRS